MSIPVIYSISNARIRFTVIATNADASHPYSKMGSNRDLNNLYLVEKPMLLLHSLLSLVIAAVAVVILMRISAGLVPSFYKVTYKYLAFDTSASDSPFMVVLALMFFCSPP